MKEDRHVGKRANPMHERGSFPPQRFDRVDGHGWKIRTLHNLQSKSTEKENLFDVSELPSDANGVVCTAIPIDLKLL